MVKGITIKKSTKNIGLHYVISHNGKPGRIAYSKAEAERIARILRKKKSLKKDSLGNIYLR